jgi:adenylate cyclase
LIIPDGLLTFFAERVLAQTERPADIVRRRLEQAGYDLVDGLDLLGAEDITFLMKFVYKSQRLGPAVSLSVFYFLY